MSKLNAKERSEIPKKEFGLPGQKKYPMENKAHARDALARASEEFHKGNISQSELDEIRRKARKVLGE